MKKLLLVEDDPLLGPLYQFLLESEGFGVTHTCYADLAVEHVTRDTVDLILLDVMLPKTSGIEILPILQRQRPNIPVVMLSNLHQPSLKKLAFDFGAIGYMIKSEYTPDTFVSSVKEFLALTV